MAGGPGKINEYNKSLTANERKKNASKAGKAPRPKLELNSNIRSIAKLINEAPAGADLKDALKRLNIKDENVSNAAGIALAVFQAAIDGNMNAVDKWERYVGQRDAYSEKADGKLADLIDGLKEPCEDDLCADAADEPDA